MAFDGDGRVLVSSGSDGRVRSVIMPPATPGTLRVVRPLSLFWLAALGVLVAACCAGAAWAAHRRDRKLEQRVAGTVAEEGELPPVRLSEPVGA
jgi:hypothetical protein